MQEVTFICTLSAAKCNDMEKLLTSELEHTRKLVNNITYLHYHDYTHTKYMILYYMTDPEFRAWNNPSFFRIY